MSRAKNSRQSLPSILIWNHFDPDYMVLPEDEVRELVLYITCRDGVEPFVRRMVALSDSLKAGKTGKVAQIARQSDERAYGLLMSSMSGAVGEGRILAARNTAFCAASCAYQNSLDYAVALLGYLDRCGRGRGQSRR